MKNKKIIITLTVTVLLVLVVVLLFIPKKTTNPLTTPLTPENTSTFPSSLTTPYFKQPTLTLDWNEATVSAPENQYPLYTFQPLLNETVANQSAQALNFQAADKETLTQNNILWKTSDQKQILFYTAKEGNISYQNLQTPSAGHAFQDEEVKLKAQSLLQLLFPNLSFTVASITYYKDNYYSAPTKSNLGEIAQVFLDQNIGNYPIIPSNLGYPHTVVIFLYKDLSLKTFSISNGFSTTEKSSSLQKFDIEKLKSLSSDSFINLTPLSLDKQSIIDSGSKSVFKVKKIEPAYIGINKNLSPIYLLTGQLQIDNGAFFPETISYIAPLNN